MRPERERHHQARRRESEALRAAKRLGGFGALATRGSRARFIDKGLRPGSNHARWRLVRSEYRLAVLAVFTAQHLEIMPQ